MSSGLTNKVRDFFHPQTDQVTALKSLDLSIEQGEILGFIGENGSGKSTTIKLLTGILRPDAGEVHVNGMRPFEERLKYVRSISAIMGQKTQLWWEVPVRDTYDVLRSIYGIPERQYQQNLQLFCDTLQIGDLLSKPARTLSLGQRVRCDFAAGFIHDPSVVFLDEPTIGLDHKITDLVRAFLKEVNKTRRTTIFLTSHDLEDIETLCTNIVLLEKGQVRYNGRMADFLAILGGTRMVEFDPGTTALPPGGFGFGDVVSGRDGVSYLIYDPATVSLNQIYSRLGQLGLNTEIKVRDVDVRTVLRHSAL